MNQTIACTEDIVTHILSRILDPVLNVQYLDYNFTLDTYA